MVSGGAALRSDLRAQPVLAGLRARVRDDLLGSLLGADLGAVILEFVAILVGIIGVREGLQTSVLGRWTGFGSAGSALIGLAIGISLVGWFGIQSAVSAEGLHQLMGFLPVWGWSLVFGLAVTAIVLWGFSSMQWVAYITVPAFLVLVGWSITRALFDHDLGALVSSQPAGPALSLIEGTTLVAGGFIVGAIITPEASRRGGGAVSSHVWSVLPRADSVQQTPWACPVPSWTISYPEPPPHPAAAPLREQAPTGPWSRRSPSAKSLCVR